MTGEKWLPVDLQIREKSSITETWQRKSEAKEIITMQLHFFAKMPKILVPARLNNITWKSTQKASHCTALVQNYKTVAQKTTR